MHRSLRTLTWIILMAGVLLVYACGEEAYYDIEVYNDAWIYGTCSIYLDGKFQFKLEAGVIGTLRQVKEGEHTIAAENDNGDIVAEETFDVSRDQTWAVADHFSIDWMFD